MHEQDRHRLILARVHEKPFVSVQDLVEMTGVSEATVRRDITSLHMTGKLRRVRGGVEALHPAEVGSLAAKHFRVAETEHLAAKRAVARAAAALCEDGDSIIINGGTTTYQMVNFLSQSRLQVFTNSFAIAEHLVRNSRHQVILPGGTVYREQSIILSPFENDEIRHFRARRMFMGAQGIGPLGVMERDPLIVQAELKLIDRADELVIVVDSSKFKKQSSLILCSLERISVLISDDKIDDTSAAMIECAGIRLIVAKSVMQDGIRTSSPPS